ncbi:hypothetical protein HRbin23_00278 [bacterium HR23]|nr:hypothetical protein HRbin23_00278 [bacterium HR23]
MDRNKVREPVPRHYEQGVQVPLWRGDGRVHEVLFRRLVPDIPSTTYATFGLYRYPAKFIPQVIAYILRTYARPGMTVFDPFAGYGTAGLVARVHGCPYILWDLNPLLPDFHRVATMAPPNLDVRTVIQAVQTYKGPAFLPEWSHLRYWHPPEFLEILGKSWGYYHSLPEGDEKLALLIPLLKVTRYFSYDDERVHKLYRSKRAVEKVQRLLAEDWRSVFYEMLAKGMTHVITKVREYHSLSPRDVGAVVEGGVDTFSRELGTDVDVLVTSPPYLQAQEYIRTIKMDLFWMGFSEGFVKQLAQQEIPYKNVPPCSVLSPTYRQLCKAIQEENLRRLYERYFWGVLGALTRLQRNVRSYMFLFVGAATLRLYPVPIDVIFAEHFSALGWVHEMTLADTIVGRVMFRPSANPATGLRNERIKKEHLVILRRG